MSADLAQSVRGAQVCAVNNACDLAPWADVIVANDAKWWREHPHAKCLTGRKFSGNRLDGIELARPSSYGPASNSGVLALDVLRNLGASRIVMLGFDMQGTHFFGQYKNACRNTTAARRKVHILQFESWRRRNASIDVVNATPGSALKAFPKADLSELMAARAT
jgi:hypothetical protein